MNFKYDTILRRSHIIIGTYYIRLVVISVYFDNKAEFIARYLVYRVV